MIETELINLAQLTKIQFSTSSQDLKLDIGPVQFQFSNEIKLFFKKELISSGKFNLSPKNVEIGFYDNQIVLNINGVRVLQDSYEMDDALYSAKFSSPDYSNLLVLSSAPHYLQALVSVFPETISENNQFKLIYDALDLCEQPTSIDPSMVKIYMLYQDENIGSLTQATQCQIQDQKITCQKQNQNERIIIQFEYKGEAIQTIPQQVYVESYSLMNFQDDEYLIVIQDSDSNTGYLNEKAVTNNEFHFQVKIYQPLVKRDAIFFQQYQSMVQDGRLMDRAKKISPSLLDLIITSPMLSKNYAYDNYTNEVNFECFISSTNEPCGETKSDSFDISFVPVNDGVHQIHSDRFLSNHFFYLDVTPYPSQGSDLSTLFSSASFVSKQTGEPISEIQIAQELEIALDLRNNLNESMMNHDCNLNKYSYYTVNGQRYYLPQNNGGQMYQSGLVQFHLMLSCQQKRYRIGCKTPMCQIMVNPEEIFEQVQIVVPVYPSEFDRERDPVDGSLTYYTGENLVFDVILMDRFGNRLKTEVDLNVFSARFQYGSATKSAFAFAITQVPGRVSFYLSVFSNQKFRALPPRAGNSYYSLNLDYTPPGDCSNLVQEVIPIKLISPDWMEPYNLIVPDKDLLDFNTRQSTFQYDTEVTAGQLGRAYVTLRSSEFLNHNDWDKQLNINIYRFIEPSWTLEPSSNCQVTTSNGIYPSEYQIWYNCTQAREDLALAIIYQDQIIYLSFKVFAGLSYKLQFQDQIEGMTVDSSATGGVEINFRITDEYGNNIDTVLIDRSRPELGQMKYTIARNGEIIKRSNIIYLGYYGSSIENNCRVVINGLELGQYQLSFELPSSQNLSYNFMVTSNDFEAISMLYTVAYLSQDLKPISKNLTLESLAQVVIEPRNHYNQTYDAAQFLDIDFSSQIVVRITNLHSREVQELQVDQDLSAQLMQQTEVDGKYPLKVVFMSKNKMKPGEYKIQAYLPRENIANGEIFVVDGIFHVDGESQILTKAELYLIKGQDKSLIWNQQEVGKYLAVGYPQGSTPDAQHYDPYYDGLLMLNAYLQDQFGQSFNLDQTLTLSLYKMKDRDGFYQKETTALSINFDYIKDYDKLTIYPKSNADQELINKLGPGHFVISTSIGDWMLSISNTALPDFQSIAQNRLYVPNKLTITAGEPYTFEVELSGTSVPKSLSIESAFEVDKLLNPIYSTKLTSLLNNRVNFISVYENRVGKYVVNLISGSTTKTVHLTVLPGEFTTIQVVKEGILTPVINGENDQYSSLGMSKTSYNEFSFTLLDSFGNNIFSQITERYRLQSTKLYDEQYVRSLIQVKHSNTMENTYIRVTRNADQFNLDFTSNNPGTITIESAFFFKGLSYYVTITGAATVPDFENSWAQLQQSTVSEFTQNRAFKLRVYLRDIYGNQIEESLSQGTLVTNIIPALSCNAQTSVKSEHRSFTSGYYEISSSMIQRCIYKVQVYYIKENKSQQIKCVTCDLTVQEESLAFEKTWFYDLARRERATMVSGHKLVNQQKVSDQYVMIDEKLVTIMEGQELITVPFHFKDNHGNIVFHNLDDNIQSIKIEVQTDSTICIPSNSIDLVFNSSAIHLIQFAWQSCISSQSTIQIYWPEKSDDPISLSINIVPLEIQEFYLDYGKSTQVNSSLSLVSFINQPSDKFMEPTNLMTIDQACVQGKKVPIIGVLDIRNDLGLRLNIPLQQAREMVTVYMQQQVQYEFQIYSGPDGKGTFLFVLFLEEITNDEAFIQLNGEVLTKFPISLNCKTGINVRQFLTEINSQPYIQGRLILTAGEPIILTFQSREDSQKVENFVQDIALVHYDGVDKWKPASMEYSILKNENDSTLITYAFEQGLQKVGTYIVKIANRLEDVSDNYIVEIHSDEVPSSQESWFNVQGSLVAGELTELEITVCDKFGNVITNSKSEPPQGYQIEFAKINLKIGMPDEYVNLREYQSFNIDDLCFPTLDKMKIVCQITLTKIGHYEFRVIQKDDGLLLPYVNKYTIVRQASPSVDLSQTLVVAMPFNNFEEEPFGMSQYMMPIITQQFIAFKAILRDKYGNQFHKSTVQSDQFMFVGQIYPEQDPQFLAFVTNLEQQVTYKNMFQGLNTQQFIVQNNLLSSNGDAVLQQLRIQLGSSTQFKDFALYLRASESQLPQQTSTLMKYTQPVVRINTPTFIQAEYIGEDGFPIVLTTFSEYIYDTNLDLILSEFPAIGDAAIYLTESLTIPLTVLPLSDPSYFTYTLTDLHTIQLQAFDLYGSALTPLPLDYPLTFLNHQSVPLTQSSSTSSLYLTFDAFPWSSGDLQLASFLPVRPQPLDISLEHSYFLVEPLTIEAGQLTTVHVQLLDQNRMECQLNDYAEIKVNQYTNLKKTSFQMSMNLTQVGYHKIQVTINGNQLKVKESWQFQQYVLVQSRLQPTIVIQQVLAKYFTEPSLWQGQRIIFQVNIADKYGNLLSSSLINNSEGYNWLSYDSGTTKYPLIPYGNTMMVQLQGQEWERFRKLMPKEQYQMFVQIYLITSKYLQNKKTIKMNSMIDQIQLEFTAEQQYFTIQSTSLCFQDDFNQYYVIQDKKQMTPLSVCSSSRAPYLQATISRISSKKLFLLYANDGYFRLLTETYSDEVFDATSYSSEGNKVYSLSQYNKDESAPSTKGFLIQDGGQITFQINEVKDSLKDQNVLIVKNRFEILKSNQYSQVSQWWYFDLNGMKSEYQSIEVYFRQDEMMISLLSQQVQYLQPKQNSNTQFPNTIIQNGNQVIFFPKVCGIHAELKGPVIVEIVDKTSTTASPCGIYFQIQIVGDTTLEYNDFISTVLFTPDHFYLNLSSSSLTAPSISSSPFSIYLSNPAFSVYEHQFIFKLDDQPLESLYLGNSLYQITMRSGNLQSLQINGQQSSIFKQQITIKEKCTKVEVIGEQKQFYTVGQSLAIRFRCEAEGMKLKYQFYEEIDQDVKQYYQVYQINEYLPNEGEYDLKILFEDQVIFLLPIKIASQNCPIDQALKSFGNEFICVDPLVKDMVSTVNCVQETPYYCKNVDGDPICVSDPSECCNTGSNINKAKWCQSQNQCLAEEEQCCDLLPETPIFCPSTQECVGQYSQCCELVNLVKCSYEDKCAPEDTASFCFQPDINKECPVGKRLCLSDGICRYEKLPCPKQKSCQTFAVQQPNLTCQLASNPTADPLDTCSRQLADGSIVQYYRCPDPSICSESLEECPALTTCEREDQMVCPNGKCVQKWSQCYYETEQYQYGCTQEYPKLCPSGICVGENGECPVTPNQITCPSGFIMCEGKCSSKACESKNCAVICPQTNICRDKIQDCPNSKICLLNEEEFRPKQQKIFLGAQICQKDNTFTPQCDNPCYDSRCDQNCMTPFSCSYGYQKYDTSVGEFCMPDNSTLPQIALLSSSHSCPYFKCLDGTCQSDPSGCPSYASCAAIRCQDNSCVVSKSLCSSVDSLVYSSLLTCLQQGLLMCQNSLQCTSDINQCNQQPSVLPVEPEQTLCLGGLLVDGGESNCPIISQKHADWCWQKEMRPCQDGSCTSEISCPQIKTDHDCPDHMPYMCVTGQCTQDETHCSLTNNGCPQGRPQKCQDGRCVSKWQECKDTEVSKTACENVGMFYCNVNSEAVCVSSLSLCISERTGCPVTKPIRCGSLCKDKPCQNDCDGCVEATFDSCPLKCPNGECKQMSFSLGQNEETCGFSQIRENQFSKIIGTCANGEVQDKCQTCNYWCEESKTCAYSEEECQGQTMCMMPYPIQCINNGKCVANVTECIVQNTCQNGQVLCSNGTCVSSYQDCISSLQLEEIKSFSLAPFYSLKNVLSTCSVICQDGSCRDSQEACPPIEGCPGAFRCPNGACSQLCSEAPECEQSLTRCEDGICREKCLEYYGCPLSLPYGCPNGKCVKQESECNGQCAGVLCSDSQCVETVDQCSTSLYGQVLIQQIVTIDNVQDNQIEIFSTQLVKVSTLQIPKGSFKQRYSRIAITSVPDSQIDLSNLLAPVLKIENFDQASDLDFNLSFSFSDPQQCLSLLRENDWVCYQRQNFEINQFGIFALVRVPLPFYQDLESNTDQTYLVTLILSVLAIVSVLIFISICIKEKITESQLRSTPEKQQVQIAQNQNKKLENQIKELEKKLKAAEEKREKEAKRQSMKIQPPEKVPPERITSKMVEEQENGPPEKSPLIRKNSTESEEQSDDYGSVGLNKIAKNYTIQALDTLENQTASQVFIQINDSQTQIIDLTREGQKKKPIYDVELKKKILKAREVKQVQKSYLEN